MTEFKLEYPNISGISKRIGITHVNCSAKGFHNFNSIKCIECNIPFPKALLIMRDIKNYGF